jgi:hypothetical protein
MVTIEYFFYYFIEEIYGKTFSINWQNQYLTFLEVALDLRVYFKPQVGSYPLSHKVRTYKEYHSVCPSSELGLSQPLSRQRVFPSPQKQGGGGTLACGWGGWEESQFRRWAYTVVLFICTYFVDTTCMSIDSRWWCSSCYIILKNHMQMTGDQRKDSPASAFLPVISCLSPTSAFRHQGSVS